MFLSDGGHIENLGLLPVLQRQADRIIIADGTHYADKRLIAADLLRALELAREWLGCSFTTVPVSKEGAEPKDSTGHTQESKYNYGDLEYDIGQRFVGLGFGKRQPYSYRFLVHYPPSEKSCTVLSNSLRHRSAGDMDWATRKTGEIIILQPRHPDDHIGYDDKVFDEDDVDDADMVEPCEICERTREWDKKKADDLTGCCFTSCTGHCKGLSHMALGQYPYFSTANQLLTPDAFKALHEDGIRAASHKEADNFFDRCIRLTGGTLGE